MQCMDDLLFIYRRSWSFIYSSCINRSGIRCSYITSSCFYDLNLRRSPSGPRNCRIPTFFRYAAPRARSERTKWAVVMSEFAPICIYLVISPLVSLIPLGVPFPFASNSSTYPEKLSAYECGFDPFGDARSRFDIRFYLVSILFIIPDPEVTFSFPWAVPPNKIDPFGSWSMMAFLLILTIGSLYEWKRGASDRE